MLHRIRDTSSVRQTSTVVSWLGVLCTFAGVIAIVSSSRVESPACVNFSVGNPTLSELYSPFYPSRYSNHTTCTRILTAEPGHVVRLHVHEFDMEVSDLTCKYDWFEVRDGPFGYSPLLGRYCGGKSPLILISTTRYVWLGFHSDDTVEAGGFRISYQYLANTDPGVPELDKNQLPICLMNVKLDNFTSTIIRSIDIQPSFKMHHAIDCTWNITAPASRRVIVYFSTLSASRSCSEASVELYEVNTIASSRLRQFCAGSMASTELKSADNRLFLRLRASAIVFQPAFDVHLTVFQQGTLLGTAGSCPDYLFHCGNNDCIDPQLVCNDVRNCLSGLDELHCHTTATAIVTTVLPVNAALFTVHTITIVTVSGIILLFAIVSLIVTCRHFASERAARRQRQREHCEQLAYKFEDAATLQLRETSLLIDSAANGRRSGGGSHPPIVVSNVKGNGDINDDMSDDVNAAVSRRRQRDAQSNELTRPVGRAGGANINLVQEVNNTDSTSQFQPLDTFLLPPPPGYKDVLDYDSSPNLSFNNEPLYTEATIEIVEPPSFPLVADRERVKSSAAAPDADVNSSSTAKSMAAAATLSSEHVAVGQDNTMSSRDRRHVMSNGPLQTMEENKPVIDSVAESALATSEDTLRQSCSQSSSRDPPRIVQTKSQQLSPLPPPRADQRKANGEAVSSLPRANIATSHEMALAASSPPVTSQSEGQVQSPQSPKKLSGASQRLQTFQAKVGQRCANHALMGPYSSAGGLGLDTVQRRPDHSNDKHNSRRSSRRQDPAQAFEPRQSPDVESALSGAGEIWKPLHLNGHSEDGESFPATGEEDSVGGKVPQPVTVAPSPPRSSLTSFAAAQSPTSRSRHQHVTINVAQPTTNGSHAPSTAAKRSNRLPVMHCGQQQQPTRAVSLEVDV